MPENQDELSSQDHSQDEKYLKPFGPCQMEGHTKTSQHH
jgi:hypothetical protein